MKLKCYSDIICFLRNINIHSSKPLQSSLKLFLTIKFCLLDNLLFILCFKCTPKQNLHYYSTRLGLTGYSIIQPTHSPPNPIKYHIKSLQLTWLTWQVNLTHSLVVFIKTQLILPLFYIYIYKLIDVGQPAYPYNESCARL